MREEIDFRKIKKIKIRLSFLRIFLNILRRFKTNKYSDF